MACKRDHGHAHGSRRSKLTDYLEANPGGSPWNSTVKPLLLVDPNRILIDQLSGSISPLCMPLSKASVLLIGTHTYGSTGGQVTILYYTRWRSFLGWLPGCFPRCGVDVPWELLWESYIKRKCGCPLSDSSLTRLRYPSCFDRCNQVLWDPLPWSL